jgi:hypothetical protein
MKRVYIHSRCEISGKVYLPGDEALVTQEQLDFLVKENAARPVKAQTITPQVPPAATIAQIDETYTQVTKSEIPVKYRQRRKKV